MNDTVIIGLGNQFRSDDGVGWAVADALLGTTDLNVPIYKEQGDIQILLELFGRFSKVYTIESIHSPAPPGTWRRLNGLVECMDEMPTTSTHGFGLPQAIALARQLHLLPEHLTIYGIVAESFIVNNELSSAVRRTVPIVASEILKELRGPCA